MTSYSIQWGKGGRILLVYISTEGSMCSHNQAETIIQFLQLEISHKVLIASKI